MSYNKLLYYETQSIYPNSQEEIFINTPIKSTYKHFPSKSFSLNENSVSSHANEPTIERKSSHSFLNDSEIKN
jgi:hypothetical protein